MLNFPKGILPSAQSFLAFCAMTFIGGIGVILCFYEVPTSNHDFIVFILGALSGAITVSGGAKAVTAFTATSSPGASSVTTDSAPSTPLPTPPPPAAIV